MKVSDLITQITRAAKDKYGTSPHANDNISVDITFLDVQDWDCNWQISLERPTQHQLERFETSDPEVMGTVRVWEARQGLRVEAPTLLDALQKMLQLVQNGDFVVEDDFYA